MELLFYCDEEFKGNNAKITQTKWKEGQNGERDRNSRRIELRAITTTTTINKQKYQSEQGSGSQNESTKRIRRGEITAKKGTTNRQFNNSSTRAIQ